MEVQHVIHSVDIALLTGLLERNGYRIRLPEGRETKWKPRKNDLVDVVVRPGRWTAGWSGFVDFTLCCTALISSDSPATSLAADWNQSIRFSRVNIQGERIVLEMDVLVEGGVDVAFLEASLTRWNRLISLFFNRLRLALTLSESGDISSLRPSPLVLLHDDTLESVTGADKLFFVGGISSAVKVTG